MELCEVMDMLMSLTVMIILLYIYTYIHQNIKFDTLNTYDVYLSNLPI